MGRVGIVALGSNIYEAKNKTMGNPKKSLIPKNKNPLEKRKGGKE